MAARSTEPDKGARALDALVQVKLVRLAELISRRASQTFEARFGVKNTELRILVILARADRPLAVSELARRARIDKAWISRSLAGLCARNLVERVAEPSHPRAPSLRLTDEGIALSCAIAPIAEQHQVELIAGLSHADVDRLVDALLVNAEAGLARDQDG